MATGTNFSGGNPIFAHALRIDLTNPGVRLLPSPPNTNSPAYETYGLSVSNFVKNTSCKWPSMLTIGTAIPWPKARGRP